jgi:hypothetical protein
MAHQGSTGARRQRERALAERRREKAARRAALKETRPQQAPMNDGVDPDIAHIVPGPQPSTSEPDE